MDAVLLSGEVITRLAAQAGLSTGIVTIGVLVLIAWSLAWKGVALWTAARNYQRWWFVALIVVNNTAGLLEIAYLLWFRRDRRAGATPSLFAQPVLPSSAATAE